MKKNTETAKIPMINQVLKDAALGHLAECGLPQSLISGVDCSSYERMEETLLEVKNCFYSSVRKNIEDTYGPSCRVYTPDDEYKHLMEYKERDYWKMFDNMDCHTESNKYIANLYCIIGDHVKLGEFGKENAKLFEKERLLEKILETGVDEELLEKLKASIATEESPLGQEILTTIVENAELAKAKDVPICQDTGLTVVFMEIGQEVHFVGGDLYEAVNAGIADGYVGGYLRKSSVDDPLFVRKNTGDNTPAIIHTTIVPGEQVKITVSPKGCGSENMGALKMLKPADGVEGVIKFVVDTVRSAGPNPCPPVTVGVGIGGNMEKAALLAKYSLTRKVGEHNPNPQYAELEKELLKRVNMTGVGPSGLGGSTTAVAVNIEYAPTHIGGLPIAVNLNCHAARRAEMVL